MNTLDLLVIGVVVLSGLFAFVRGFVREILSIMAWLGAFAVAYYGYDHVVWLAERFIGNPTIAHVTAAAVLFVISLLVFSVLVGIVSSHVRDSSMGSVDRTLGLVFGLVRGVLVVALAYLVMIRLIEPGTWPPHPDGLPPWVAEARLRPFLERCAEPLQHVVTEEAMVRGAAAAAEAGQTLQDATQPNDSGNGANPRASPPEGKPRSGYDNRERDDLNRTIEQSTDQ